MSEIFNPNYNDMPTQVEVNKRDIEKLKGLVKKAYTTTQDYGEQQGYPILSVPLTTTNLPQDTEVGVFSGFMITRDGVLTNIINIDYEYISEVQTKVVNASYVCSLKGDKGDTGSDGPVGPVGPQGPAGDPGDQIYVAEYVAPTPSSVGTIANIPWSATNVPVDIENVPDSIMLVGNGWFYHIDGYVTSSDPTGYDLVCSAVADVKGPAGENGVDGRDGTDGVTPNISMTATVNNTTGTPTVTVTKTGTTTNPLFSLAFENLKGMNGENGIYTSNQMTQGQPGNYQYLDLSLTNIPLDTPLGSLYGMIITVSGEIWYELQIAMHEGVKSVYAGFFQRIKGEKGDDAVSLSIGTVTTGQTADASLTSDGDGNYTLDLTIPSGGGGGGEPSYTLAKAGSNMQPTLGNLPNLSVDPNYRALYGFYHDDFKHKELDRLINTKSTGISSFALENLWSDGVYLYYFDYVNDNGTYIFLYYYFNEATQTWVDISAYTPRNEFDGNMNTLDSFYIRGKNIYSVSGKWIVNDYDWYYPSVNPDLESGVYVIEPDCICSGDSSCFNIYRAILSFDSGVWGLSNSSITKANIFNFNGKSYYIGSPEGSYFQYQLFIEGSGEYQTLHVATISTPLFNNNQVLLGNMGKFDDSLYYNKDTTGLYKCANDLTLNPTHVNVWFMDNDSYDWSPIDYVSFNHVFSVKDRKYAIMSLYVYDDMEQTYAEVYNGLCYFYDDNDGNIYLTPAIIYMPNYDIGIDDSEYQYYYKIGEPNGYNLPLTHLCLDGNTYYISPLQAYDSVNDFYFWAMIKVDNRVR